MKKKIMRPSLINFNASMYPIILTLESQNRHIQADNITIVIFVCEVLFFYAFIIVKLN